MKYLRVLQSGLLFTALGLAQAPYQNISHYWWGSKTAFAGHSNWYEFQPITAVPVSCNPAQSRCTAPGYQFQGGERAYFYAEGTAPTGLYTLWDATQAVYGVCDLQGVSFTLRENTCSGPVVPFSDGGTGRQNVLVHLGRPTYFTNVSGFPPGTVLNWYSAYPGITGPLPQSNGVPWQYDSVLAMLEAVIPDTAAGVYNVSVTVATDSFGNNASTLNWQIYVRSPPAPPSARVTYTPAIPGLSQWESTMRAANNGGGQVWCANPKDPTDIFAFGVESEVWYYDGARVYFNIADYTGDPTWNNCAHNIASQYADYAIGANGGVPPWRVFPHGLARAALKYPGEPKFLQAFNLMLNKGFVTPYGGRLDDIIIRETSYALNFYTVAESVLGYPRNPHMQHTAEFIMSMLLSYTDNTSRYTMNQTFYDGLAMEALIGYYQLTKDTRVLVVVRRMLDSIWANYDQVNHVIIYNPDPVGPHCSDTPTWWEGAAGDCAYHNIYGKILHNLISGAFAWYWSVTANDTYRAEGDELFQHCLDFPPFSGKEFSQAYRWSFYYVTTRTTGNGIHTR
jgi:hypothetical protein